MAYKVTVTVSPRTITITMDEETALALSAVGGIVTLFTLQEFFCGDRAAEEFGIDKIRRSLAELYDELRKNGIELEGND